MECSVLSEDGVPACPSARVLRAGGRAMARAYWAAGAACGAGAPAEPFRLAVRTPSPEARGEARAVLLQRAAHPTQVCDDVDLARRRVCVSAHGALESDAGLLCLWFLRFRQ